MAPGMCSGKLYRTRVYNATVFADVKVVACTLKTTCPMSSIQILLRKITILTRGRAVHHNQVDGSHTPYCLDKHS